MALYSTEAERDLLALVARRGAAEITSDLRRLRNVTQVARQHGVEGFLPLQPDAAAATTRELALRMQHDARVREVRAIGAALAEHRIDGVLLKGVGLAERFYERPWMRCSSDVDLLVMPEALDRVLAIVARLGYKVEAGARARFSRARHFHVEAVSAAGTLLEVHFIAYRGFGSQIAAADLFAGRASLGAFPGLFVPAPARELVYLSVHAAAHRFMRVGWLVDLVVVLERAAPGLLDEARAFARQVRFAEAFELALGLVQSRFGVNVTGAPRARTRLAEAIASEPDAPLLRAASRFMYTALLCDGVRECARYVARATIDKASFPRQ